MTEEARPSPSQDVDERRDTIFAGTGGAFGLSADWREAIRERKGRDSAIGVGGDSDDGDGVRGEACMTNAMRNHTRKVLEKRETNTSTKKVR